MGSRTRAVLSRPGGSRPSRALEFGLALSACSFTLLASTVNVLTAVLALVGNLFYVVVYTGYLKRRGPQNIVLGGAAGAVPPLVGYAAATGDLELPAVWLFLIVFLWTPPHFWALALLLRDHYAAADVPMLPVVRGERATVQRIVGYTVALVAFTVVPFAAGAFGLVYLVGALVLGGVFLVLARTARQRRAAPCRARLPLLAALPRAALRRGGGRRVVLGGSDEIVAESPFRQTLLRAGRAVIDGRPPRTTSSTSHMRACSWPGTRQAMRKLPVRRATNEKVAFCAG